MLYKREQKNCSRWRKKPKKILRYLSAIDWSIARSNLDISLQFAALNWSFKGALPKNVYTDFFFKSKISV